MRSLLARSSVGASPSVAQSSLWVTRRHTAGGSLLGPLHKLGQSKNLAEDVRQGRKRDNLAVIRELENVQTWDEIQYRKVDAPWDLVPKYARRRVTDLVGIMKSEHRMECEQTIEKMNPICDVDFYVVLVPTAGYVSPKTFANSLFFNWQVGEPRGNGLLLVVFQREAELHIVAGNSFEEFFGERFVKPLIDEVFLPYVKEGDTSMAVVQTTYAVARHAQECRHLWQGGLLPMPVRNRARFAAKTVVYGARRQTHYVIGTAIFLMLSTYLANQVVDSCCPKCGTFMHRVRTEEGMKKTMEHGQWLEMKNGCAHYRIWRCPKCHNGNRVQLISRDLHQNEKCLKCMDCEYYTCSMTSTIEKLPSRSEDGIKRLLYTCENCRIGRDVALPLYRPLDKQPDLEWYDFLVQRAQTPKSTKIDLKTHLIGGSDESKVDQ